MGLGPSKEKIRKILEKSMTNPNSNEQKNLKIEYKYKQADGMDFDESRASAANREDSNFSEGDESFTFSRDDSQSITSPNQDVKSLKKFPYIAIGSLTAKFQNANDFVSTCFLIDTNVILTLASNLYNRN